MKKTAMLLPGFSEGEKFVTPFAEALMDPHTGIYDEVEIGLLGDALKHPEGLARYLAQDTLKDVVTHSAGAIALARAMHWAKQNGFHANIGNIIATSAPHPTILPKTVIGGVKVMLASHPIEEGVETPGMVTEVYRNINELRKFPVQNANVPLLVRDFSSSVFLVGVQRDESCVAGSMLQATNDEFGFTQAEHQNYAESHGVAVGSITGGHNTPLIQPTAAVEAIHELVAV